MEKINEKNKKKKLVTLTNVIVSLLLWIPAVYFAIKSQNEHVEDFLVPSSYLIVLALFAFIFILSVCRIFADPFMYINGFLSASAFLWLGLPIILLFIVYMPYLLIIPVVFIMFAMIKKKMNPQSVEEIQKNTETKTPQKDILPDIPLDKGIIS